MYRQTIDVPAEPPRRVKMRQTSYILHFCEDSNFLDTPIPDSREHGKYNLTSGYCYHAANLVPFEI